MADYGLEIHNTLNILQIDSTYQNLAYRTKGVLTAGSGTGFSSWANGSAVIPYSPTGALAWRADGPACLYSCVASGGSMVATWGTYTAGRSSAVTIWWYLFDRPTIVGAPAPGYGLCVKDANRVVTYDSRMAYLPHMAALRGLDTDLPTTQVNLPPVERSYFIGNGIVPAVLQGNQSSYTTEQPTGVGPGVDFMFFAGESCVRQVAGALNLSYPNRVAGPYSQSMNVPTIRRPSWRYVVIDVSKF